MTPDGKQVTLTFRKGLKWPSKFAEKGAVRVMEYDDIRKHLSPTAH